MEDIKMGREIRRVIPNWQHPEEEKYDPFKRRKVTRFKPLYDEPYRTAIAEWIESHNLWLDGNHPDQNHESAKEYKFYAEYDGDAPEYKYYRPDWKPEDMTWYQVYETVSEGTPVTPPFETKEELIEYLVENGDFWDQQSRREGDTIMNCDPWPRQQAEAFVNGPGWAPSMVIENGKIMSGVEAIRWLKEPNGNKIHCIILHPQLENPKARPRCTR